MVSENYQGLGTICDVGTTHTELINAAMPICVALYSKQPGTSLESARYTLHVLTKKKRNPKVMVSPSTSANLAAHTLCSFSSHVAESS